MDQQKKRRGENWSPEEKEILRQLICQSAHIIEDKCTKSCSNILKTKEWKNIMLKLNEITGKTRSEIELKLAWKRMKLAAKANVSAHRQQQQQTGGGAKPPSPSQEDLAVMAIAPHDFVVEINNYDSDAVNVDNKQIHEEAIPGSSTSIIEPLLKNTISNNPASQNKMEEVTFETVETDKPYIKMPKKSKKGSQNISDIMRESIISSNNNFKKRQLQMLEVEHSYNIQIAQLKIKKLELEISLLESKKNS